MRNKQTFFDQTVGILLLIIFGGIIIHTPISVWLSSLWPSYELLIKSWKEILLLLAAILTVVELIRQQQWRFVLRDRLLQLVAAIGLLNILIVLAVPNAPLTEIAGLLIGLRYYLFFGLVYIYVRRFPAVKQKFMTVFIAGATLVVAFSLLQVFVLPRDVLSQIGYSDQTIKPYLTVDLNPDYVRINSTLRGPNPLGAYAVIVLSVLGAMAVYKQWPRSRWWRLAGSVLFGGALVSLWSSYSRSAVVAAVVMAGTLAFATGVKWLSRRTLWMVVTCLVLLGCVGSLLVATQRDMIANVVFHTNLDGGSAVKSDHGHVASLKRGITGVVEQPIGYGIGSSGSASLLGDQPNIIEDQYIATAWQSGLIGLGMTLWLFIAVLLRLFQQRRDALSLAVLASGLGMAVIGIVLPVWTDDVVSLIWWGLAAIAVGTSAQGSNSWLQRKEQHGKTSHQKTN